MKQTTIDLFAGCGGFSLGAQAAGIDVIAAYEFDPKICDGYAAIAGDHIHCEDLFRIDPHLIPDADGIIGGPPCQGFSHSGKRLLENDPRNGFPAAINIVRIKQPSWFLFENVIGFVQSDYFHVVLSEFKSLGYHVDWRIINAADFGIPQTRFRVFIYGIKQKQPVIWPEPTHVKVADMFISQQWLGWETVIKDESYLKPKPLPNWILSRVASTPHTAYFNKQLGDFQRKTVLWREVGTPAFTVTVGKDSPIPIVMNGRGYRSTTKMQAALQGLPCSDKLNQHMIGNAVPPRMAEAVVSSLVGTGMGL